MNFKQTQIALKRIPVNIDIETILCLFKEICDDVKADEGKVLEKCTVNSSDELLKQLCWLARLTTRIYKNNEAALREIDSKSRWMSSEEKLIGCLKELEQLENELSTKEEKHIEQQKQISTKKQELEVKASNIRFIQEKNEQDILKIQELSVKLEEKEKQFQAACIDRERISSLISEYDTTKIPEVQKDICVLQQKFKEKEEALEEINAEYAKRDEILKELEARLEEREQASKEYCRHRDDLNRNCSALELDIQKCKQDIWEIEREIQTNSETYQGMLQRKRDLVKDLEETVSNVKHIETDTLAKQRQLTEMQNELNVKKKKCQDELQTVELRLTTFQNELKMVLEELDKKRKTLECLKNDLQMMKDNCSKVDQQKASIQAEIKYLSEEGERLKTVSIPELELKKERLKQDYDECVRNKESIEEEIAKKEHIIHEIEKNYNKIQVEKEQLLKRVQEEELRIQEAYSEEKKQAEELLKKKRNELENEKKEFSVYFEKTKAAYIAEKEALKSETDSLEKNKKIWDERNTRDKAENERLVLQIGSVKEHVENLEKEIAENELRLEQLIEEERTFLGKINTSQEEILKITDRNRRTYQQYCSKLKILEMVTKNVHDDIESMISNHCDTISRDVGDSLKIFLKRAHEDMEGWKIALEKVQQFLQTNAL